MSDRLKGALVHSSDSGKGLAKWQLALLVGLPIAAVVVGSAIYFYVRRRRHGKEEEGAEQPDSRAQSVTSEGGSATADGDAPDTDKKRETPKGPSTLDQARAIKQQGNELYKQEKFDEAIKCYEKAIEMCPRGPEHKEDLAIFHQNVAAAYDAMSSQLEAVVAYSSQALELNPRYVKALTRRLKASEVLGRKKDALMDVTRILLLDDAQGKSLAKTVSRLLKEIGRELTAEQFPKLGPLAPTKHLVKTYFESFVWSDDLSEARLKELWSSAVTKPNPPVQSDPPEQSLEQQEQQVPESGQSEPTVESHDQSHQSEDSFSNEPFVRAASLFIESRYDGIIDLLTEAIEHGHAVFIPHARLLRGAMYSLWREDSKALKDFQDVINSQGLSDQMYVNALIKRAAIFASSYEMDKCRTCFDKAIAIDPKATDVFIHRARVSLEGDDINGLSAVSEDLEKAIKLAPNCPFALYSLASTYHRIAGIHQSMQLLESARIRFEDAVRKFPNFVDGLILYSMFLQDLSDFQKAEEILNKGVKLEPENPLAHFSLGLLSLVYRQDMETAMSAMETAISVDNSCIQAYDTLASLEMQRGNSGRAMELYEKAIQFSRTQVEMSQACVSKEIVTAQERACQEYGISPNDLAARTNPASFQ